MEELLIIVVIILVIVCAVIFGLLCGHIFPSRSAPEVKRAMTGGGIKKFTEIPVKVGGVSGEFETDANNFIAGINNAPASEDEIWNNFENLMVGGPDIITSAANNILESIEQDWVDDDIANEINEIIKKMQDVVAVIDDPNADVFHTPFSDVDKQKTRTDSDAFATEIIDVIKSIANHDIAKICLDNEAAINDECLKFLEGAAGGLDNAIDDVIMDEFNDPVLKNALGALIKAEYSDKLDTIVTNMGNPPFNDIPTNNQIIDAPPTHDMIDKLNTFYVEYAADAIKFAGKLKDWCNAILGVYVATTKNTLDLTPLIIGAKTISDNYLNGTVDAATSHAALTAIGVQYTTLDGDITARLATHATALSAIAPVKAKYIKYFEDDTTGVCEINDHYVNKLEKYLKDDIGKLETLQKEMLIFKADYDSALDLYDREARGVHYPSPLGPFPEEPAPKDEPNAAPAAAYDETKLSSFKEYIQYFAGLPQVLHKAAEHPNIETYGAVANYMSKINDPKNLENLLTKAPPDGADVVEYMHYRVLHNYVNSFIVSKCDEIAKLIGANKILEWWQKSANYGTYKTNFDAAGPATTTLENDAKNHYDQAIADVYLSDVANHTSLLQNDISTYTHADHIPHLEQIEREYAGVDVARAAVDGYALIPAPPAYAETDPLVTATGVRIPLITQIPDFNHNVHVTEIKTFVPRLTKMETLVIGATALLPDARRKLGVANTYLDECRAKISALAKNIMSALKAEFVESSARIEAVKQDLEEQDRRDRARKRKEAEERQKLADDEYNARLDALSQIPDETLADRVARIPAEYSNVIHFAMAKRAAKLTGDTSYDVSAAEIGNTAVVRDKLVRFFTAQGIKDVTRDNINQSYARWQKKNTARLVHQSDIDNPSGVILELS